MKQTTILKNGVMTHRGQFESQQELDAWLAKHIAKNTFGLPERPELALNEETGEMEATGVILPAEFTIEIEDITAQVEQERINAEALAYLASTDWLIIRELDAGIACPVEVKIARQEARQRIVK
jgi:hypothetical protein